MKRSEIFKYHISKKLPALLVAVFLTVAFFLYYVGVYDISFIERPESWKGNLDAFVAILNKSYKEDPPKKEEDKPVETEPAETEPAETERPKPQRPTGESQAEVFTFSHVSYLKSVGYKLSDKTWEKGFVMGILNTPYSLPKDLSTSYTVRDTEKFVTYDDGRETEREIVKTEQKRLALEMYMGYIIYDDGGVQYLIGPDGTILTRFNDTEYKLAYCRDKDGCPLFYKSYKYKLEYPTVLGAADKDGKKPWVETKKLDVEGQKYYYLSPNGHTFLESDYNDATDSRGLYFDYPTYYGTSDNNLHRYCMNSTKVFTTLDGKTSVFPASRWGYSSKPINLAQLSFDKDGKNLSDPAGKDYNTMFPYTKAFNYSEGYATVLRDIKWDYYNDEQDENGNVITPNKYYQVVSNELRVVDKDGKNMFESRKNYFSNLGWTANERYVEPLSKGIDSIGSYYYDHGYMRLRVQSYDRFYFTNLDSIFIVSDEDVLVDPKGNVLPLPTGYKIKGYSDGIILLEKDGLLGYMDTSGNWIMDPNMEVAGPFMEGIAVCKNKEGSFGAITTDGTVVIPFRYEYMSNVSSGTLLAYNKGSGWTIYQKMSVQ